jgi:hypothetical protein
MAIAMTTSYSFTPNELLTLGVAAYAAVISTFVLGWDAYKWLASGAKIDLKASPNMKIIGGLVLDHSTYISITAWNIGDQPTTISNLGMIYYESWFQAYIKPKKPKESFIVKEPSQTQRIPFRFEVGDQWVGLVIQTDDVNEKINIGYLFLVLYTAGRGHGHRVRVKITQKKPLVIDDPAPQDYPQSPDESAPA